MKTIRLVGGDVVLGAGGFETATGPEMVAQDLRCALAEPLGNDRFHPGYGSVLDSFIGQTQSDDLATRVEDEVTRVTGNYSAIQADFLARSGWTSRPARNTDEILAQVGEVKVTPTPTAYLVDISIQTLDGSSVNINLQTGA